MGYRIGYNHGARVTIANGTAKLPLQNKGFDPQNMPMHNFGNGFDPQDMPMHNFGRGNDRGFNRGFGPGGFGMMDRGMRGGGIGFFFSLIHIAVLGLIIWLVYKWFKNSGWTLTRQTVQNTNVESADTEKKSE